MCVCVCVCVLCVCVCVCVCVSAALLTRHTGGLSIVFASGLFHVKR